MSGPPIWRRSALQALGGASGGTSGAPTGSTAARQRLSLCRALLGAVEGDTLTALNAFMQYYSVREAEGEAAAARWADRYLVEDETMRRAAAKQQVLLRCLDSLGLPRVSPSK